MLFDRAADPIIEQRTTQATGGRIVKIVAVGGSGASGSGMSVSSRATATLSSGSKTYGSKVRAPVSSNLQVGDQEGEDMRTCTVPGCNSHNKLYTSVKCYKAHEK